MKSDKKESKKENSKEAKNDKINKSKKEKSKYLNSSTPTPEKNLQNPQKILNGNTSPYNIMKFKDNSKHKKSNSDKLHNLPTNKNKFGKIKVKFNLPQYNSPSPVPRKTRNYKNYSNKENIDSLNKKTNNFATPTKSSERSKKKYYRKF